MNNELEKVLAKAVEQGLALAEKTGEFVIEQAPDLLQQFYSWHLWANVMGLVFAIGIILIGRYLPYTWLSKEAEGYHDIRFFNRYGDDGAVTAFILAAICWLVGGISLIIKIYKIVYILVAPKLYLIDYFIGRV